MDTILEQQFELCGKAFSAEFSGDLDKAVAGFSAAIALNQNNPAPLLYLGFALAKQGKLEAAKQAYSLAADLSPNTVNAWRNSEVSADIRERSKHADEVIREHFTQLHRTAVGEFQTNYPAANLERVVEAIWCGTHEQEFSFKTEDQQPHLFYVPDLAPIAVFDAQNYEWCAQIEAATDVIREEFLALSQDPEISGTPYIDASSSHLDESWQPLVGSNNWSSLHLYKSDKRYQKIINKVPVTHSLLNEVPLLRTYGQPREVLFSVLQGKQHIPPHFGLANTDMTVHLPLLNLQDCAIKVGTKEYPWQAGKLFLFDDSFIHESWNNSDKARVNLLFATWHPDLTTDEQNAIAYSFVKRESWNRARKI